MPKVIENLQEKIFDAAIKLFGEKGYENVDMKAIAKESNIAVGTLYNYYSNKRGLYIKVLESSWEGTFNKLQKIVISDLSDREKINKIVEYLYYDIKDRKGLGNYFITGDFLPKEKAEINTDKIVQNILIFLKENNTMLKNREKEELEKLIYMILCTIVLLVNKYGDKDKENLNALKKLLDSFV
ncbi:TetR/AcrR family transcriptional regulator [Clostridium chauvoei]|uniref:TetR/AcrR family transcriptional regulator n=3 Tax=Clostridium chauvoei TaxID=46867 RepID=A0ABD4REC6_9CLOT|nr:TetR/AcrR family transcriptional regulator [Clostridium chauvoei]ATD55162.1 hypothetical protein BTM20_07870 [Clostridium chauvoei]ATD57165.1 hypothetical protein BTM21_05180 [Clostridium chauvoei]MBX7279501.1 TetR/AcrR family transcriptional regulator [Clostridium chauvoei]MBX7281870.1 TetR/AcrR family transcriptional regulator [Clostridium chauvoei]MBX7284541.1 TetR/AcrR family transcriptional regulator [Clostridium chauvoei]